MTKNITYHQTAAMAGRRTRRDGAAVAGAGLAGLAMTRGRGLTGLEHVARDAATGFRAARETKVPGVHEARNAAKFGAKMAGGALKKVDPLKGGSQAAVGIGGAMVAGGEAKNKYHTHAEQKLRRNRKVSKAMDKKAYCKKHGKFDDCATKGAEVKKSAGATGHDVFGVDVEEVAKAAYTAPAKKGQRSKGRAVAASALGAYHAPFAAKKGEKLAATGSAVGHTLAGGAIGSAVGGALTRGHLAGSIVGNQAGSIAGGYAAYRSNSAKGRFKKLGK